jgi:hypothetical protein
VTRNRRTDPFALASSASEPTRSASTEASYQKCFDRLWAQFGAQNPPYNRLDVTTYAHWLIGRRHDLDAATFRQYRSASIFMIGERLGDETFAYGEREDSLRALSLLLASRYPFSTGSTGDRVCSKPLPRRTSAKKAKTVSPRDWDRLMATLALSRSRHVRAIGLLLSAGLYTGLRPSEWRDAHLTIEPVSGERRLTVVNGKNSNGRAHGPTRTLIWPQTCPEVDVIAAWMTHLDKLLPYDRDERARKWEVLYGTWRDKLYEITRKLWPRRRQRPCFYTTRHMFAAAAKDACLSGVCSREELAALLGHATDATASTHYARPSRNGKAKRPFTLPVADPSEVARVRQVMNEREAKATYRIVLEETTEDEMHPKMVSP